MRAIVAAALIALLAGAAYAQGGVAGGKRHAQPQSEHAKEDSAKKKAEEKAYQDALQRIPEVKEKSDPWKSMR